MATKMEKVLHNGKVVALKVSSMQDGSVSITEPEAALQALTLKHPKGKLVAPHMHLPHVRETVNLQECLIVIRGKLRVSFFDEEANPFAHLDIAAGEACITLSAAHSIEFLEDSEVFEIKNGPYLDDKKLLEAS